MANEITTTPPDFTERARQLVEDEFDLPSLFKGSELICENLVQRIASFAAEAATQRQMAYIERVRQIANSELQAAQRGERGMKKEFEIGAAYTALVIRDAIIALSPDPDYLNRVRSEAATAALEQAAQAIDNCTCGSGPEFRPVKMRYHAATCTTHLATMIRNLKAVGGDKK